jgi:hypothetical protein
MIRPDLTPNRWVLFAGLLCVLMFATLPASDTTQPATNTRRVFLIDPSKLDDKLLAKLTADGASAIVIELSEQHTAADYQKAAVIASTARLPLFGWVEVARNEALANSHPEWMASLGMHGDWQKRFPDFAKPAADDVVKVWPWVPIWTSEAYAAHLGRIKKLLAAAPPSLAGLYLNDIQAAPASCGCGNDQCRWAMDYRVKSTATKLIDPGTPARFVADVKKLLPGKPIVPVWCIECEEIDVATSQPNTGLCGSVPCFKGLCWKEYFKQLTPVLKETGGVVAAAALTRELGRDRTEYAKRSGWLPTVFDTFRVLAPLHDAPVVSFSSLDIVLQGWDDQPDKLRREIEQAESNRVRQVIVSLIKIDQTWRPEKYPSK